MSGEKNLSVLISSMCPHLNDGEYVFCSIPDIALLKGATPVATMLESEGLTVVIERDTAENLGISFSYVAAWITLDVHSALEAVGLTAAFATALGKENISANVIAGFYHDHIFVAKEDAGKAIAALRALAVAHK